jgi:hypothetical protein
VTGSSWSIRRATAEDGKFLADMLVEAVNWSPGWKPRSRRRVLADPRTAHYIAGWPRGTDLGVIAEAGSQPAGAAWIRFFPAGQPGYGFVSPDVPELTIGVAAPWRGRGVGRASCGHRRAGRAGGHQADQPERGAEELRPRPLPVRGLRGSGRHPPQSDTMVKSLRVTG